VHEPPTGLVNRLGRWSAGRGPLYVLLAARLRRMIDDGELAPGAALPPDRALARALSVGRATVVAAYDLLGQDGRIVRRQGSGTRVAPALRPATAPADSAEPLFLHLLEPPDAVVQLTCAAPDEVPPALVEAYRRALDAPGAAGMGYHPAGHPVLRRAVAERFTRRGLPTGPDQVLVTTGAQQALSLLARLLLAPGDRVLVEAPTYPGALEVFREAAARLRGIPVRPGDGLDVDAFVRALRERPALGYLVPTHHNPTGAVLPALARRRVVEAATALDVPLVDDQTLADLGPTDPPPLAGPTVFSVGSLSKLVWGGLRVGWLRGPVPAVRRLARLKAVHDLGSNVLAQLAAAELLADLDAVRAARVAELRERHDRLCAELAARLPQWRFAPAPGGQTLWVELPRGDGVSFAQAALRHGVAVLPGGSLDVSGGSAAFLRLPFLAPPGELAGAVERLAVAWRGYAPAREVVAGLPPLVV
jgi:DNA-binding transcriptional MocR family regulator